MHSWKNIPCIQGSASEGSVKTKNENTMHSKNQRHVIGKPKAAHAGIKENDVENKTKGSA